jgi:hypothetical protein
MPIIENQIKKIIARESLKTLQGGQVIDITFIAKTIAEKVRQLNGGPTMQLYLQEANTKFNVEAYNRMMEDILFDIEILYDSILEKSEDVMRQFNSAEVSYRSQQTQLSAIMGILDNLLFTTRNGDDYFFGVFDTFNTLDKVDLNKSSKNIVDLAEGCLQLPYSMPSAKRHELPHLVKSNAGNIQVRSFNGKKTRGKNGGNSIYGYAFSDINTIWRYEVISESQDGVELLFTFPLNQNESIARLTRVELSVPSGGGMTARLLYSLDGENYIRPPGTTDKQILAETKKIAWDFQDTGMRYIRFAITKLVADGQVTNNEGSQQLFSPIASPEPIKSIEPILGMKAAPQYLYSFNISLIACYKIGRSIDGIFVSKPLAFEDQESSIDYVALESEEEIPANTSVDYEVALADAKGNPTTSFIPLTPSNRSDSNVPKVIRFGKSTKDLVDVSVGGSVSANSITNNGISFYPIHTLDANKEYKFGACRLYRGDNLFSKVTNPSEVIKQVRNAYIDFSDGKKTKVFYSVVTKPCTMNVFAVSQNNGPLLFRSFVRTPSEIIKNTNPKPGPEDDPQTDASPDYSVYKLELLTNTTVVTGQSIYPGQPSTTIEGIQIPASTVWTGALMTQASYGIPILYSGKPVDIVYNATEKPVLSYVSGSFSHTFRDGIDYIVKRSDDSYFDNLNGWSKYPLHWRLIGNNGGQSQMPPYSFGSGKFVPATGALRIDYTIDTDITDRIINAGNDQIELDSIITFNPGDTLLATYKTRPSSVDRRTIRVKGTPTSQSYFQENVDYTLDINNSTITKIIGGALDTNGTQTCYIDYAYKSPVNSTITYSAWCYLDSREPVVFDYIKPSIYKELGESIVWTYLDAGRPVAKELSDVETFTLSKGWHLFVITSLDPEFHSDAAITKTLRLRSIDNRYLFLRKDYGGSIFTKITGRRSPLRQVDFSFLKNSTLKTDNSTFAIDENNKIYINFLPTATDDFYFKRIDSSGNITNVLDEEFVFEGLRKLESSSEQNTGYVVVRALLSRNSASDGGVTPKVHSYNLRVSY